MSLLPSRFERERLRWRLLLGIMFPCRQPGETAARRLSIPSSEAACLPQGGQNSLVPGLSSVGILDMTSELYGFVQGPLRSAFNMKYVRVNVKHTRVRNHRHLSTQTVNMST